MKNLEQKLAGYKRQLEMSENSIVSHQYIVEVGAYTIALDSEGKTELVTKDYPSQFTENALKQIKDISFSDGRGNKVEPEVYFYKDWYLDQIESLEMIVQHS